MMRKEDKLTTITVHEEGLVDSAIENLVNGKREELGHTGEYKHIAL